MRHTSDPLTQEQVNYILDNSKNKKRVEIAKELGISADRVSSVILGKSYKDLNLIIVHMGGGISIGLHEKGKVVDVNNALGGEGPFSPERAGTLPVSGIIDFWHENPSLTQTDLKRLLVTKGGLYSYLNTSSGMEIAKRIKNNDEEAKFYLTAMLYQVIKNIGSLYFAAKGDIDAVIFTGGLVYQKYLQEKIKKMMLPNLKVVFYPGEDEIGRASCRERV